MRQKKLFSGTCCVCALGVAFVLGGRVSVSMGQSRRHSPTTQLGPDFKPAMIRMADGTTQPYAVFLPERYDAKQAWPLVVFLHGSGESGADGIRQTQVGLGPFISHYRKFCPFIAVFPQSPNYKIWFRGAEARVVFAIIERVQKDYHVDPDRIYLTGISMGGFGTWEMAMMRPDLFAAIVPVCGGGPVEAVGNLKEMPIWAFHGASDDRVPVENTRRLIERLKQLGADPKYTEFPMLGHMCWDDAYATKGLFPWLLKQKLPPPPTVMRLELDLTWSSIPTTVRWLRIDAAEPGAKLMRVAAAITSATTVQIESEGVGALTLLPERFPGAASAGQPAAMTVAWQNRVAYKGPWRAEITMGRATTRPARRGADAPMAP